MQGGVLQAEMLGGNQGGTASGRGGVSTSWRNVPGMTLRRPGYGDGKPKSLENAAGLNDIPGGAVRGGGGSSGGGGASGGYDDGAGGVPTYAQSERDNRSIPASQRYNNPGAQWPSKETERFGGVKANEGVIGGGNKIAWYPTPVHGLASNIALAQRLYVGKPIGAAISKWSNGGRNSVPGYDSNQILTPEIANDPKFWQAMSHAESGRNTVSRGQVTRAMEMVRAGSAEAYERQQVDRGVLDRSGIDRANGGGAQTHTGKLDVDVKAPPGSKVNYAGTGLLRPTSMQRQVQMPETERGPTAAGTAAQYVASQGGGGGGGGGGGW
jgi:hypothetical protein